jgi:hypothetical protein
MEEAGADCKLLSSRNPIDEEIFICDDEDDIVEDQSFLKGKEAWKISKDYHDKILASRRKPAMALTTQATVGASYKE